MDKLLTVHRDLACTCQISVLFQACKACRNRETQNFWQGPQQAKRRGPLWIMEAIFSPTFHDPNTTQLILSADKIQNASIQTSSLPKTIDIGNFRLCGLYLNGYINSAPALVIYSVPIIIPNVQNMYLTIVERPGTTASGSGSIKIHSTDHEIVFESKQSWYLNASGPTLNLAFIIFT